jgi:hypothetical protein
VITKEIEFNNSLHSAFLKIGKKCVSRTLIGWLLTRGGGGAINLSDWLIASARAITQRNRVSPVERYLQELWEIRSSGAGVKETTYYTALHLPRTECPLVIRTDFEDQRAWETICKTIRAPVPAPRRLVLRIRGVS